MTGCVSAILLLSVCQVKDEPVGRGPEPSPIPISWELDFKFLDLQRIAVQASGQTETYWYMVYTATNTSDRTIHFFPMFQIVTEDLQAHDSDMGIHPDVFAAIRERHKKTHPYLVGPTEAIGPLKSGEDNARESVAIWRQFDLKVNNITVYVAGLSGESRFVRNPGAASSAALRTESQPAAGAGAGDGATAEKAGAVGGAANKSAPASDKSPGPGIPVKNFTLRKTLEIPYTLPGSPATRELGEPQRGKVRWIMR